MKKYILMSALALGLCMTSCDSYLDINQDPTSPSEGNVTSNMILPGAEMAMANAYGNYLRITGGYHSEIYAQLSGTSNYVDYSQFQQSATRSSLMYTQFYEQTLVNLKTVLEKSEASEDWGTYLAATTLRAFTYEALVDCYGETPYSEALDANNLSAKYDDGKTVYEGVIAELDNALSKATASSSVATNFLFEGQNAEPWIKFAKALKLKMLMRMANVDSSVLPQAKALIDENDFPTEDVAYKDCWGTESGNMNPFFAEEFSPAWGSNQTNVCANLTIIGSMQIKDAEGNITYTDPRLAKFFEPNADGKYVGGVSGTNYPGTTSLTKWCRPIESATSPLDLLTVAETEFFIAEYYARTNEAGNAATHYAKAIEASFATAGADGAAAHIAKFPYDQNNWKKSIGVQKWIALAGVNTFEAWCEVRRLDYPAFGSKKGTDFYTIGKDDSFKDTGYEAGTLYTPVQVFTMVGDNKLLERFPYAEASTSGNSNAPKFTNSDYTKPIFWGE